MNRLKYIAWPAYLVAFLLVLFPISETLLAVWPLRLGTTSWRFGAAGLFSRALMTPMLAILLAFATAVMLEHRTFQRVLSYLNGLVAVVLLGVISLFLLDALQMRAQVNPEVKTAFDVAAVVALGKYGIAWIASVVFCVAGLKSVKAMSAAPAAARPATAKPNKLIQVAAPVKAEVPAADEAQSEAGTPRSLQPGTLR